MTRKKAHIISHSHWDRELVFTTGKFEI
ncbi:hypothetical protein G161_00690 [Listeria monocytogenes FSL F6-684]|nr:hypothetical protein G161_00690 [Listeria monocytogenes FSL F6-684]